MVSPENTNWLFDYALIDDIPVSDGSFAFTWPPSHPLNVCVDMDGSLGDSDGIKDPGSKKRGRLDSSAPSSSKACREKQRRDRLNDKYKF